MTGLRRKYRARITRPWFNKVRKVVTNLAEAKFKDERMSNPIFMGGGSQSLTLSLMNNILQGTTSDASTRVGNRIFVKGIWMSVKIIPNTAEQDGMRIPSFCRILVLKNKEGVAGLANIFEVLTANGQSSTSASWTSAYRNSLFYKKYQVLSDRVHQMSPGATSGTNTLSGPGGVATWYIPINRQFNYRASSAVAGNFEFPAGSGTVITSNTVHDVNNILGEDYQVLLTTDNDDAGCCQVTLSWKVLFNDF